MATSDGDLVLPKLALSVRGPWWWLILHANKDIENRDWPTKFRGTIFLHASKGMTRAEYEDGDDMLWLDPGAELPPYEKLERGGIVGTVEIADCVTDSDSEWFFGKYGFVLRNPKPLPFAPCKGSLGFFKPPVDAVSRIAATREAR